MYKKIIPILLLLLLIPTAIIQITAQVNENNWQHPAFDRTNTGFSPQTQINKDNIQDLELKWIFQVPGYWGNAGGVPGEVIEADDDHDHGENVSDHIDYDHDDVHIDVEQDDEEKQATAFSARWSHFIDLNEVNHFEFGTSYYVDYEKSFVGIIENSQNKYFIDNLSVPSYSPTVYYYQIKKIQQEKISWLNLPLARFLMSFQIGPLSRH